MIDEGNGSPKGALPLLEIGKGRRGRGPDRASNLEWAPSSEPPPASPPPRAPSPVADQRLRPFDEEVRLFITAFVRAVRGVRMYPANHPTVVKYFEDAHTQLATILTRDAPLSLRVFEDRLLHGDAVVHVDDDRMEGLPFGLFGNSIHEIEFLEGLETLELVRMVEAFSRDYSSDELAGEDLVTTLWHLDLPHFDYVVVDALSLGRDGTRATADAETLRLREDIRALVDVLQPDEPPKTIRATGLLAQPDVDALLRERASQDRHEALVKRLTELLLGALSAETEVGDELPGWQLLLGLVDAMFRSGLLRDANTLVARLEETVKRTTRRQELQLIEQLFAHMRTRDVFESIVKALDASPDADDHRAGLKLIRRLGDSALTSLLSTIDLVENPTVRRELTNVLAERLEERIDLMLPGLSRTRAEVVRDLLLHAESQPRDVGSSLLWLAVEHEHESVRARGAQLLNTFEGPSASLLLSRLIDDEDPTVRLPALVSARDRQHPKLEEALLARLQPPKIDELEATELRHVMGTLGTVAETRAVEIMADLLTASGRIGLRQASTSVQVAAAIVLGEVGGTSAAKALESGARTLNSKVRAACRDAYRIAMDPKMTYDPTPPRHSLGPRPVTLDASPQMFIETGEHPPIRTIKVTPAERRPPTSGGTPLSAIQLVRTANFEPDVDVLIETPVEASDEVVILDPLEEIEGGPD